MKLSSQTSIHELLKTYPFLTDFLVAYNPQFGMLKNKVMRATVGKVASLKQVAGMGGIPLDKLIKDIAAEIELHSGESAEDKTETQAESVSSNEKIALLKEIILDLHKGLPYDTVKKRFDDLIADVEVVEIVAMEQQLISEGIPASEVQRLSELHVGVFKEALDAKELPETPAGHPVHSFMEENRIFTETVADLDLLIQQLQIAGSPEKFDELEHALQDALETLSRLEIHYQRKENQLFPYLEKHEITGPSQVMWTADDDIRTQVKQLKEAFDNRQLAAFLEKGVPCAQAVVDMIYKENSILFPISLETLDEAEWIEIKQGEADIGYAFTEAVGDWPGTALDSESASATATAEESTGRIELDTGQMTVEQINLMLKHLPVDVTFVDENDRVQYFSAGKERIFPRSPGIIGRNVQNCHPPKSLDIVNQIVGEFKAGTKDEADFRLQMEGCFIYIRYFAVRDDEGAYCGTLEVSQDISNIKTLEGERRLLNWETE
ncbi:MAG: DUF438 domain-containing protein [bacterium]|nr:DUF438 domain-containing protein [bacterium]